MSLTCPSSPSERVRLFLDEESRRLTQEATVRLPPVRQIAALLKVSTATVHHVYKEMLRDGRIQTGVGRGSFLVNPALAGKTNDNRRLCIAITAPIANSDTREQGAWGRIIVTSIVKALSQHPRRITLLPLGGPSLSPQEGFEQLIREREHVDGLIFGVQNHLLGYREKLEEAYESAGKPMIAIHSQELFYSSSNSVLTDFFLPSRTLGAALYRAGRRRIVCLCLQGLEFAVSNQQRFFGLQLGVSSAGGAPEEFPTYWRAEDSGINDGYDTVKRYLAKSRTAPDAISCAGDYLALGAIRALEEAGLSVPNDVSVIGSTGVNLDGTIRPNMTRMLQRFDVIADCIIQMLLRRIDQRERRVPGEYPAISWHIGDTTTEAENRFLEQG